MLIARRFRFGDKKEAAGVCRGCGLAMDFQSQAADIQWLGTLHRKATTAL
jgi:hypothetical protein